MYGFCIDTYMPPRAAPASPSESWTVEQVAHWLRQLQVPMNVIAEFISNDITGKALFLLEDDDLEYELLVRSLPQRRTILAAVERARSMAVAAAAATSCAAAAARASTESSAVARRPAPAPPADVRGTHNGHAGSALASAPASQALMLACHLSNSAVQMQVERAQVCRSALRSLVLCSPCRAQPRPRLQAELGGVYPAVVPVAPTQLFLPLAQVRLRPNALLGVTTKTTMVALVAW